MVNIGNTLIFGDSYSTFENHIPEGYAVYYSAQESPNTDVRKVEQTWWHRVMAQAGLELVLEEGPENIGRRESELVGFTARGLEERGYEVFHGPHQLGTLSFRGKEDGQTLCDRLDGIALRAGLHCAPLAHKSTGTLDTGTVRVSFGWNSTKADALRLLGEI